MAFQIRAAEKNDFPLWAENGATRSGVNILTAQHLVDLGSDLVPHLKLYGFVAQGSKKLIGFSEASVRFL